MYMLYFTKFLSSTELDLNSFKPWTRTRTRTREINRELELELAKNFCEFISLIISTFKWNMEMNNINEYLGLIDESKITKEKICPAFPEDGCRYCVFRN